MADQWLSIVEYARYYNVSDMTVRRRIRTGKLHAVLREGKYYIPLKGEGRGHSSYVDDHDLSEPLDEPLVINPPQRPTHSQTAHLGGLHKRPNQPRPGYRTRMPQVQAQFVETRPNPGRIMGASPNEAMPAAITSPLRDHATVVCESKALLSFCESVIARLNESERRLEGDFQNKLTALEEKAKSLEAQLNAKEVKISELMQQVEDLQLLVSIIEKHKKTS